MWQVAALISNSTAVGAVLLATLDHHGTLQLSQEGNTDAAVKFFRVWWPKSALVIAPSIAGSMLLSYAAYKSSHNNYWLYAGLSQTFTMAYSVFVVFPGPVKKLLQPASTGKELSSSEIDECITSFHNLHIPRVISTLASFAFAGLAFCPHYSKISLV